MTVMILSPTPVEQFTDSNGNLLVGGQLFLYAAGTTTPLNAYTDSTGNTPLPNPIILNSRGEVAPSGTGTSCGLWLYPTSAYKMVLAPADDTNPPTNPIWTIDNINVQQLPPGVQLGDMKASALGIEGEGWRLCYGQTRPQTDPLWTYILAQALESTWLPGYNNLNGTYTMPDCRGATLVGLTNMGGTPSTNLTQAVAGFDPTKLLNTGGSQHAQQDTLTATATSSATSTATTTATDSGHQHGSGAGTNGFLVSVNSGGLGGLAAGSSVAISSGTAFGTANITATTSVTTTVTTTPTVTSGLTGASQNIQPAMMAALMMYVGA